MWVLLTRLASTQGAVANALQVGEAAAEEVDRVANPRVQEAELHRVRKEAYPMVHDVASPNQGVVQEVDRRPLREEVQEGPHHQVHLNRRALVAVERDAWGMQDNQGVPGLEVHGEGHQGVQEHRQVLLLLEGLRDLLQGLHDMRTVHVHADVTGKLEKLESFRQEHAWR